MVIVIQIRNVDIYGSILGSKGIYAREVRDITRTASNKQDNNIHLFTIYSLKKHVECSIIYHIIPKYTIQYIYKPFYTFIWVYLSVFECIWVYLSEKTCRIHVCTCVTCFFSTLNRLMCTLKNVFAVLC